MDNKTYFEDELLRFLPSENCEQHRLIQSMRYSLSAGGKRIRPLLTIEFAKLCGGTEEKALPFACAVEMVHTYSLIHDDLPCMDNDDLRRGKPSNHKAFDEPTALLAGDALLTLAFETVLSEEAVRLNGASVCTKAGRLLAQYAGACGMCGGQQIDLENENQPISLDLLQKMDERKTGALIKAACQLGCISAAASDEAIKAAGVYAGNIGLVFQIVDDILDVTSNTAVLGKPVGSDKENCKNTYVSLLGIDKCREICEQKTKEAIQVLSCFDGNTVSLVDLAIQLLNRQK